MKEVLAQFSAVFVCFACLRVALVAESLVSRRWQNGQCSQEFERF